MPNQNTTKWASLDCAQKIRVKVGVGVLVTATLISCGFGSHDARIKSCVATAKTYLVAEFSEDYLVSVSYSCGDTYCTSIETETRYWTKPASVEWVAQTVDGYLKSSRDTNPYLSEGYYAPDYPPLNVDYSRDQDFDRYKEHLNVSTTTVLTDGTTAGLSAGDYLSCLLKINHKVQVNTWYGWQYSADYE
jgi:hypothetical protein